MTDKKKVGRPERYLGEKNVQLSVTIRPRYRQAIEIIAKDRNSTLSEAVEIAISKLARETRLQQDYGDKHAPYIIDYVRNEHEPLDRIFFAYSSRHITLKYFDIVNIDNTYAEIMDKLNDTPGPLLSPFELHLGDIIDNFRDQLDGFNSIYLKEAIAEDWKEGIPSEETEINIKIVLDFYKDIYEEKFWELNAKPIASATKEEMQEYLDNIIEPFSSIDEKLEALYQYYEKNY